MSRESARKGGELEAWHTKRLYLHRWVNLRWLHASFYSRPRVGVNAMLRQHKMSFEGRPHSGIDDARNIARLAVCLLQDGCRMPLNDGLEDQFSVHWSLRRSGGRRSKSKKRKR